MFALHFGISAFLVASITVVLCRYTKCSELLLFLHILEVCRVSKTLSSVQVLIQQWIVFQYSSFHIKGWTFIYINIYNIQIIYFMLFHLNCYSYAYFNPRSCQILFRDCELYFVFTMYYNKTIIIICCLLFLFTFFIVLVLYVCRLG
jgi:hypothetical protein